MGITRQLAALDDLLRRAAKVPEIEAVVLIGSLASGAADSVSDVDAIVIVRESSFDAGRQQRHALHTASVPACWDYPIDPPSEVTAHKWIDDSGVLVGVLIATASDHCGSPSRPESYSATPRCSPARLGGHRSHARR